MSNRKSFLLRLDPRLWDELNSWAAQELRSVNSQIEFILREAVMRRRKINLNEKEKEKPM
ncbi:MAG: hypothetical protein AB1656_27030 [Candidatus Omnitrophota bacterium]